MAAPVGSGRLAELRPVGDPVVIVYGSATDDVFIGQDYIERRLETELWERLRAEGFQRIVYSSNRDGVYFLDAESRRLSRRRDPDRAAAPRKMARFRGPLGDIVLTAKPAELAQASVPGRASAETSPGGDGQASAAPPGAGDRTEPPAAQDVRPVPGHDH